MFWSKLRRLFARRQKRRKVRKSFKPSLIGLSCEVLEDRSVPSRLLPDLIGTALEYSVPSDQTGARNGPLPVNASFVVTATVANASAWPLSRQTAAKSSASFYLSTDSSIDPWKDLFLGTVTIKSLASSEKTTVTTTLQLPDNLSRQFFGRVWLGMVVDSRGAVVESNESNNSNRGLKLDFRTVQLYDPVPPRGSVPASFSQSSGENYLRQNGFAPPIRLRDGIWTGQWDTGWSRPVADETFSRYNGEIMPADAFRIEGYWRRAENAVHIQGADRTFNAAAIDKVFGEPSPRNALSHGVGWAFYVWAFHRRF